MKRKATNFFIMALLISLLATLCGCQSSGSASRSIPAVENFDVARYMGTWYEIARLPQWFERNMKDVRAEYTLQSDGTVKIMNFGIKNGEVKRAEGVARFKGWKMIGSLEVSFDKHFYSDYRIIRLAPDYHYAVVTSKSKNSLWILARTPQLPQAELDELLSFIISNDFDISRLEYSTQMDK